MRWIVLATGLVSGGCLAADLTGDWGIEARLGETPIRVNCALVQTGAELAGTCTPVMENPETSELSGTVDEMKAVWAYDVVFNGAPGHVAFDAEIETDSRMSGTLNLSGTPVSFVAIKRGPQ